MRDRTPARTPTPPHLDVPHMGPITPDLAPRLRAVAREHPVIIITAQTASSVGAIHSYDSAQQPPSSL